MPGPRRAVFLDRDGVLIRESDLLVHPDGVVVLDGVPQALARLAAAGFALVGVTNQPVVARGLCTLDDVAAVHRRVDSMLAAAGGPALDAWYFCPHHPEATIAEWRALCDCRKPRPGLLLRAARELGLDLGGSVLVGDRMSDVGAGQRAGCRTVLVRSGAHAAPPIVSPDPVGPEVRPDHEAADLAGATDWMVEHRP